MVAEALEHLSQRITTVLQRTGTPRLLLTSGLSVAIVGLVDYLTGPDISVALFYLVPIALAAWFIGLWAGCAVAIASAAVWLTAEMGTGTSPFVVGLILWNACVRLGFFLITALLLHRLHREMERRSRLVRDLQSAMAQVKVLRGLLPICAWCKKVRDDDGYWGQVEEYIQNRTDASFTHSICPECLRKMAAEVQQREDEAG